MSSYHKVLLGSELDVGCVCITPLYGMKGIYASLLSAFTHATHKGILSSLSLIKSDDLI